jgi:hypothetical protein
MSEVVISETIANLLDNVTKENKTKISCKQCNSLILQEMCAKYIEEINEIPLMDSKAPCESTEKLKDFWLVDNMMKFENIGFTNTVKNYKYLICADCEIGPLGFQNLENQNKIYIAIDRVKHG